jgi:hypothetical protein
MHAQLENAISAVRKRMRRQVLLRCVATGCVLGGVIGVTTAAVRILAGGYIPWWLVPIATLAAPVIAAVHGSRQTVSDDSAARAIDDRYSLKNRIQTALAFSQTAQPTEAQSMQIAEALPHLSGIDPTRIVPTPMPKQIYGGCAAIVVAIGLAFSPVISWRFAHREPVLVDPFANLSPTPGNELADLPDSDTAVVARSRENPPVLVGRQRIAQEYFLRRSTQDAEP